MCTNKREIFNKIKWNMIMLMMGCSFLVCSFSDFSTCAHIIFLRSSSKNRSSHKRYVLSFYDDMIRELSILMRDTYINFEWLVNMTLRTRKRIIIFSSTLVHLLLYSFKSSSNPHYETIFQTIILASLYSPLNWVYRVFSHTWHQRCTG